MKMYSQRINRVRQQLIKEKIDALLIADGINIEYLTGFSGSYGYLLLGSNCSFLFTDARYYERCQKEVTAVKVRLLKDEHFGVILALLRKYRIKRLGFEAYSLTYQEWKAWQRRLSQLKLVPVAQLLLRLRMVKEPQELKVIRQAARITDSILAKVKRKLQIGVSELDMVNLIENLMKTVYAADPAFPTIVAYGSHTAMPHAKPMRKRLTNNQLVLIDLGVQTQGYSSDLTRSLLLGRITRKFQEIYSIVLVAQQLAIDSIAPGKVIAEIDQQVRDFIRSKGYGRYFTHGLGHGIGKSVHELPHINNKNNDCLQPGMVFSVEPGIYLPGWGGVRIEDMVLVTERGCQVLSKSPKGLKEIIIPN